MASASAVNELGYSISNVRSSNSNTSISQLNYQTQFYDGKSQYGDCYLGTALWIGTLTNVVNGDTISFTLPTLSRDAGIFAKLLSY